MAKQAVEYAKKEFKRWMWSTILTFLAGACTELLHQAMTLESMEITGMKWAAIVGVMAAVVRAGFKAINERLIMKK